MELFINKLKYSKNHNGIKCQSILIIHKRQEYTWNVWAYAIDQWQLMPCLLMASSSCSIHFHWLITQILQQWIRDQFFSHEKIRMTLSIFINIFFLIMNHSVIRIASELCKFRNKKREITEVIVSTYRIFIIEKIKCNWNQRFLFYLRQN